MEGRAEKGKEERLQRTEKRKGKRRGWKVDNKKRKVDVEEKMKGKETYTTTIKRSVKRGKE